MKVKRETVKVYVFTFYSLVPTNVGIFVIFNFQ